MSSPTVGSHEPLRIAHVINEPFAAESANGVQQVVYCLANVLADTGRLVAVFSREGGDVHVLGSEGAPTRNSAARSPIIIGRFAGHGLLCRYFERELAESLGAWAPDIVHFHSVHIVQNVALAAGLVQAGVPYCVTVHGGLFQPALQRGRLKKAILNVVAEREYLNAALFVHALSPAEAEVIRRRGVRQSIVVIPNGLPPGVAGSASRPHWLYERWPAMSGRRVFMFIGRLDPWQKGLDLLIEAFAHSDLRDAGLVLIGPDCHGSLNRLEDHARRLGISRQVVFTGAAFGDDRANLFAAADVFVHPSRWEGVSLSVLGAAASAKPCVITREADPLGQLERAAAAILVEPTVSSIAAGLKHAATLPEHQLQAMGERARQVAETHFTWPSIAERFVHAYRRALKHAGTRDLDHVPSPLRS